AGGEGEGVGGRASTWRLAGRWRRCTVRQANRLGRQHVPARGASPRRAPAIRSRSPPDALKVQLGDMTPPLHRITRQVRIYADRGRVEPKADLCPVGTSLTAGQARGGKYF